MPTEIRVGQSMVSVTSLNKVYWPEDGYTKQHLIEYYRAIAPLMLPYLHDRPQVLHRHPGGINGEAFWQKDVGGQLPHFASTIQIESESTGRPVNYLLCQNEETLVYMANLGCIEINPWISRVGSLSNPDCMVMDLDPEGLPFEEVVRVAQAVHEVLDEVRAPSHVKTSGKTGLHIVVPLTKANTFEQAREMAGAVGHVVNWRLPQLTSLDRSPANRQNRVYLDYLQNKIGQNLAAPYSLRPIRQALVSTPLAWSEVRTGLAPSDFTISTIQKRLDRVGDLWRPVPDEGIDASEVLKQLERILSTLPPRQSSA